MLEIKSRHLTWGWPKRAKKITKHVEQLELFVKWVIVGEMIENIIFSGNSSWINKIRNLKYFFVCFTFTIQKTSHAFLENERPYLTLALYMKFSKFPSSITNQGELNFWLTLKKRHHKLKLKSRKKMFLK